MDKFLKKSAVKQPLKIEDHPQIEALATHNTNIQSATNFDAKSNDKVEDHNDSKASIINDSDKPATEKVELIKSDKTPNKRKKLKRNTEEREENIQLSAQTISETPEQINTTLISNECPTNNNMEEDKNNDSNLNMEVEDNNNQDCVRRSKRGRKPKTLMEDQEPQSDKKRTRKQKQKVMDDSAPENVEDLKSSIKVYQKLLQKLINAGISENFNLDKSNDAENLKKALGTEQIMDKKEDNEMEVDPEINPTNANDANQPPLTPSQEPFDKPSNNDSSCAPCSVCKLNYSECKCDKLHDSINNDIVEEDKMNEDNSQQSELSEIEKCIEDNDEQANNESLTPIDTKLLEEQIRILLEKNKVKKLELKENQSLEKKQLKLAKLQEKEAQRLERQRLKEEKEAMKKEKQQEAEKLKQQKLEEKQKKLQEIAQKKEEEKQRKLQEIVLKKQEQEEAKRKKEEEIQRKKEEEIKRKEELIKAQKAKENSQKKLLNFFKKNSPKKEEIKVEEQKKETIDILSEIKKQTEDCSDELESKFNNITEYSLYLK